MFEYYKLTEIHKIPQSTDTAFLKRYVQAYLISKYVDSVNAAGLPDVAAWSRIGILGKDIGHNRTEHAQKPGAIFFHHDPFQLPCTKAFRHKTREFGFACSCCIKPISGSFRQF